MQIKITSGTLKDALGMVRDSADARGTLPILGFVKIETVGDDTVRLTTTNLDTTMTVSCSCEVKVAGAAVLPHGYLSSVVGGLPAGEIVIACDKSDGSEKALVTAGDARFRMQTADIKNFPVAAPVEGAGIVVGKANLASLLKKSSYASSTDETRRTLMSVLLELKGDTIAAVATDGRRLGFATCPAKETENVPSADAQAMLPTAAVKVVRKMLGGEGDVRIRLSGKAAEFTTSSATLMTKLIDDIYPNYRRVIPSDGEMVSVDVEMLRNAVSLAALSASEGSVINLTFDKGFISISSSNDMAESALSIPAKGDVPATNVHMDARYLLDVLNSLDDDEVVVSVTNGTSPLKFKEGDSVLAVIMPMR